MWRRALASCVLGHRETEDMSVPPTLWRTLELASVLMNIGGDLSRPPALTAS
jgi:hypothetical protein